MISIDQALAIIDARVAPLASEDVALNDAAGWKQMLDDALEQTGGPPTGEERAWVASILGPVKSRARKARA